MNFVDTYRPLTNFTRERDYTMRKLMSWIKSNKSIVIPLGITNYVYESKGSKRRFAFGYKQKPVYHNQDN